MSSELTLQLDLGREFTQLIRAVKHLSRHMEALMSDVEKLTAMVTRLQSGFYELKSALEHGGVMQNNPAVAQAVSNIETVIGSMADETAKLGMPPTP